MVRRVLNLVYGGGRVGLMGEIAIAVMATGGTVVGVIPESLVGKISPYAGANDMGVDHRRTSG